MQKNFLKILTLILIFSALLAPSFARADLMGDIGENLGEFRGALGLPGTVDTSPITIIINLINVLLGLLGLFFVILIIYAGFVWMTAQGDADKVKKAKDIIKNSIWGVAIILLAFVIANWVVKIVIDVIEQGGNIKL